MVDPTLTQLGEGGPTLAQLEIDLADAAGRFIGGLIAIGRVTAQTINAGGSPNFQNGSRANELTEQDPALIAEAVAATKKFIAAHVEVALGQLNRARSTRVTS